MFEKLNITNELIRLREKTRSGGELVLHEATKILKQDLFSDRQILDNLKQYNRAAEVIEEEEVDPHLIFTSSEIKKMAVLYRLKFLDSKVYKPETPYECVLKLSYLNDTFKKNLSGFKIVSIPQSFTKKESTGGALLFARTNYDNYYLVHCWGKALPAWRKYRFWPLRYFENLFISILVFTLILTLSIPTKLISLDPKAEYWSGYRAAAFFHLLIFNMGVTAYFTFAFSQNFSSSIWNSEKD